MFGWLWRRFALHLFVLFVICCLLVLLFIIFMNISQICLYLSSAHSFLEQNKNRWKMA
jgi:hypothetical protein